MIVFIYKYTAPTKRLQKTQAIKHGTFEPICEERAHLLEMCKSYTINLKLKLYIFFGHLKYSKSHYGSDH